MSKEETKDQFFKVRITREERDYLQAEANRLNITLSSLIRNFIINGKLINTKK